MSNFGTKKNLPLGKRNLEPKWIEIHNTKTTLPAEEITKQANFLLNIVRQTNVAFDCSETDESYQFEVTPEGNIDRDNIHVYLEEGSLVIETRKEAKDKISFQTLDWGDIPVKERSILYVRHAILLPANADPSSVKTQSIGEAINVEVPKLGR